jgi:hypothetical protein
MHPHLIVILLLGRVLAQQDAGVPVCAVGLSLPFLY